jgi:hypothetical protein
VKKRGSVKIRERVMRVESEEKGGGVYRDRGVERRGGIAYKQLCYKIYTVLTYSHFIRLLYTATKYMALYK